MVKRSGLGLVEVLFTLLLMGIALVPIFGMFTGNVRHVAFNADRAMAQMLAQQVIERYRLETVDYLAKTFPDLEGSDAILAKDPLLANVLTVDEDFAKAATNFTRQLQFIPMDGHRRCGQLICRVSWRVQNKRECEMYLKTVLYDEGAGNEAN